MLPYSILQAMVVAALAFWAQLGAFTAPQVALVNRPGRAHIAAAALPVEDGVCTVYLWESFYDLPPERQEIAITHEVGHCLGLNHIDGPGIMNAGLAPTLVASPADVAEFERIQMRNRVWAEEDATYQRYWNDYRDRYLHHRVFVPGLAH